MRHVKNGSKRKDFNRLENHMKNATAVLKADDPAAMRLKILRELRDAGDTGRTKTELLVSLRVSTAKITPVLEELIARFQVVGQLMRKREFSLGRPVTRYWLAEHAPIGLTAPAPQDIPESNPEPEPAPAGSACRQCGAALPDRQVSYCSDACKRLAGAGGVTLADLLAQARDPRAFARCARRLVEIDLLCRGYEVTPVLDAGANILVVYDGQSAILVYVMPISPDGCFPATNECASVAMVYRDGRIIYGGQYPLGEKGCENERQPV
jgi:hypothetical protein